MKKTIFLALIAGICALASCSKNNNASTDSSWTFKSATYYPTTCVFSGTTLIADNNTNSPSQLECYFNTVPVNSGNYLVVSGPLVQPNQVQISMNGTIGGYVSTGGNGTQTVAVNISGGKVSVSGSGITMSSSSDSAALVLNITQTN